MKLKNIYILLLQVFLLSAVVGCKDKKTCDNDPIVRLQQKLELTNKTLTEAPNGWILKMYPHQDLKYGGFNVFMRFTNDGKVIATSDLLQEHNELHESMYSLSGNDGASITFNTYNRAIHMFSEPSSDVFTESAPYGADGDFVFKILNVTPEKITIRGVRSGVEMEMVPVPKDASWEDMITKMKQMRNTMNLAKYKLSFGNNRYVNYSVSPFDRVISFNGIGEIPFRYTTDGIELYKPMNFGGETIQTMTLKEGTTVPTLVSKSGNVTIESVELSWPDRITSGIWFTSVDNVQDRRGKALYGAMKASLDRLGAQQNNTWTNASLSWIFIGKYSDPNEGTGFGVWTALKTNKIFTFVYMPMTPTVYDDQPDKITFKYNGAEKPNTNSEYLAKNLNFNILVYPFAHIGDKPALNFTDTNDSRTFTVSVERNTGGEDPLVVLKLTDVNSPANVIFLFNKMIKSPLTPHP